MPEALGKGQIALGKAFAECGTRQRTHGKKLIGKVFFAESPGGTRQRKATVTAPAPLTALGEDFLFFLKKNFFAECPLSDPWQRCFIFFLKILCRVPLASARQSLNFFYKKFLYRVPSGRHSAKFDFFFKKILCRVSWSQHSAKQEK